MLFSSLLINLIGEQHGENKIVHQADREHQTGNMYSIDRAYVEKAIETVKLFVNTLHRLLVA